MKMQEQVREFHEKFGLEVRDEIDSDYYDGFSVDLIGLRLKLIKEECDETIDELEKLVRDDENIFEVAKELADLMYVVLGTAVSFGIDMEKVFDEVHRSNMSKVWEDGTIHRREDGKILKPPTYSPADIEKVLTNT